MTLHYYIPESGAGILKKWFYHPVPDFPETVLLETRSGCNGRCIFCPYEQVRDTLPQGEMEEAIFQKVVDELAGYRPKNLIPCFLNEPLLDSNLIKKLSYIHQRAPKTRISLTTNASLLTEEMTASLADEGFLSEINISFQGISKEVYEYSMPGLSYDRTRKNVEYLIHYVQKKKKKKKLPEITITMVRTRIVVPEIRKALKYWKKMAVKAKVLDYENRSSEVNDQISAKKMFPYNTCKRPFDTAVITFDGKVVLCCVDYKRKMIMGDLHEESLHKIWNGKKFQDVRRLFLSGRREDIPACKACRIAD